jgi:hypothetical protein
MEIKELKELFKEIESWDCSILPKKDGPYTVALVDENDLNGLVEFIDKNGIPRLQLPRKDYDDIKNYGKGTYDKKSN